MIELRDARIPSSTAHPLVKEWVGTARPRIVVFARVDMVPSEAIEMWRKHILTDPHREDKVRESAC